MKKAISKCINQALFLITGKLKYGSIHKKRVNQRGFGYYKFKDSYDYECSIQMSSSAMEDKIWFGIDDPKPQIMASQAAAFGVKTNEDAGWVPYPIPDEVCLSTRMHLTRSQVKELIPILQCFVETGGI